MNAPSGELAVRLSAAGAFGRGAIVLSVLVHGGLAAAFVGWGDAPPAPASALPVAFVAVPATEIVTDLAPPTLTVAAPSETLPATSPERGETAASLSEPAPTDFRATAAPARVTEVASRPIAVAPPEKPDPPATIATRTDVVASTAQPAAPAAATPAPASVDEAAIARDRDTPPSPPAVDAVADASAQPSPERVPASGTQFAALPADAANSDSVPAAEPDFEPARFDLATLSNPRPDYPWLSRQRGEEGRVVLRVEVTVDGRVASIDVAESSGHRRLDEAALETVLLWTFEPARVGDEPVATTVNVPVTFQLQN